MLRNQWPPSSESAQFLQDLPKEVDPCGERGEFHTFVYDGPIFQRPINIKVGKIVERDGFVFADVDFQAD